MTSPPQTRWRWRMNWTKQERFRMTMIRRLISSIVCSRQPSAILSLPLSVSLPRKGRPLDAGKILSELWRLLDIAQAAGRKMRLQDQANDLSLSHEVRMFAVELAKGNGNIGGAYWDAKQAVKSLSQPPAQPKEDRGAGRFVNCETCQTEGRILTNDGGPYDVDHGECPDCKGQRVVEVETKPVKLEDLKRELCQDQDDCQYPDCGCPINFNRSQK